LQNRVDASGNVTSRGSLITGRHAEPAQWKTFLRVLGHLRPYRLRMAGALVTFVAAGGALIALGQGVRRLLDVGLHGTAASLDASALLLLGLVAIYGASGLARAYLSGFIGERVTTDLRQQLVTKLMAHGPGFFEAESSNVLWSRVVADVGAIGTMLGALVAGSRAAVILVGGAWAMLTTSILLSILVILLGLGVVAATLWMGARIRRLSDGVQQLSALSNSFALELFGGIRDVKAFGQERRLAGRFDELAEEGFRTADRRNFIHGCTVGVSIWLIFGAMILLAWYAGRQIIEGQTSEGRASAFLFYGIVVAMSVASLADLWAQLQKGLGGAERIFALLDQTPDIRAPATPQRLPAPVRARLTLERVSFRYPMRPEVSAINDLSWSFEPNTRTAVVGPSGAGKSTLFHLLLRLYDPSAGAIRIDGIDIRNLDLGELRAHIGVVPQNPTLFEGSLFENICFGRPDATADEIVAAAQAANVMEFAQQLPKGLQTEVGARGAQLSGGQRQRIAIARVFLRNPQILILDEATNALDAASEALINSALSALAPGKTTLVIAHKLATVRDADNILVMERGSLVSHGPHAKLMAENGLYADFAALQLL
jgi:ATP-binding cassette subfamily B protein